MTPSEALHTAARRYCLERIAELRAQYRNLRESRGEQEKLPPREAVAEAILIEVERLKPTEFHSRKQALSRLIETAQVAQSWRTQQKHWQKPPFTMGMEEERTRFSDAVRQIAAQKTPAVEPLPYRRTLEESESDLLMRELRERWGIAGRWWIPFETYSLPYEVVVFDTAAMEALIGTISLKQILADHNIERIFELYERNRSRPDRELALSLWDPYTPFGAEIYWGTAELDLLIYTTHENSTTIAGHWLLRELKAKWPAWSEHLWTAPWKQPSEAG